MSYFSDAYNLVSYPLGSEDREGLRKSQLGAIHAVSAHFTLEHQPAVVVLPTGSGKTAVLMLTPYVLQAQRALIISPSRFVREQIVQDYSTLRTLKKMGALPEGAQPPSILENKNKIISAEMWEACRLYDVVVSTPNSASPGYKSIPAPPNDLFDVVLVDEAHHSAAETWNALIEAFPTARYALFTATPFRSDGKEIKGKYIFTYPIQRAFEDGVYGEMDFSAVQLNSGDNSDEMIARATDSRFHEDRAANLGHVVMVRADTRDRANNLAEIYARNTALRLEVVHSGKGIRAVEKVIRQLRSGELDGVICVNMLGEGFDLPNLKIAALHSPHRSLAVTLQFFGRFARVNGERLGRATFLAVPGEIKVGFDEIFVESPAWGKKIMNIGQDRISQELAVRDSLRDYEEIQGDANATVGDLSLYSFNLLNHVKIYQVHGDVNLDITEGLGGLETVRTWRSQRQSSLVLLMRERVHPKWSAVNGLEKIEHYLFVLYFDEETELLFICASEGIRDESIYKDLAKTFVEGYAQALSLGKINRVLRGLVNLELFNIGMRNRSVGTVAESYRQMAGAAVHNSIDSSDGALYHRGHIFGKGDTPEGATTIGLSSLSKVWRLDRTKIPQLVAWCKNLASEIANPAPFLTGTELDHLDAGRDITELPNEIVIAIDWQDDFYKHPPLVRSPNTAAADKGKSILNYDLKVNFELSTPHAVVFFIIGSDVMTRLQFTLAPHPKLEYLNDAEPRLIIDRGFRKIDLIDYLMDNPLRFHMADGSVFEGNQIFDAPQDYLPYDVELMREVDFLSLNVNIEKEYGDCTPHISIHEWLQHDLVNSDTEVVFYDHRSGECADFLTVRVGADGSPTLSLYHCKRSGGPNPGDRMNDFYEVCGQATKSVQWRSKKRLIRQVEDRLKSGSIFYKGTMESFLDLVEPINRSELPLEIFIVQPGVSKNGTSERQASLLSSTSIGLVAAGCEKLRVISSMRKSG